MGDLIVSVPDHCLSFYYCFFVYLSSFSLPSDCYVTGLNIAKTCHIAKN